MRVLRWNVSEVENKWLGSAEERKASSSRFKYTRSVFIICIRVGMRTCHEDRQNLIDGTFLAAFDLSTFNTMFLETHSHIVFPSQNRANCEPRFEGSKSILPANATTVLRYLLRCEQRLDVQQFIELCFASRTFLCVRLRSPEFMLVFWSVLFIQLYRAFDLQANSIMH